MYVEKTRIGEKPLYNDLPRAHPLLSFACLKQRTLRFKGPRSFRLSEDRISSFLKYLVFDKSASLGADSRTNRDNIKLVLVDKNGMHASVLFSEDDWDIRKRVAVFTRFPEDEARNLTVDFFTCLLTASEANCFRSVTMSVGFDRSQFASSMRRKGWHFDWEVLTDGVSVSIVLAQFLSPAPYAIIPAAPAPQLPQRSPPPVPSVTGPVAATHPVVQTAARIVGLDPGRNNLFVAAVHSQHAENMIGAPQPTPADRYESFGWSRSKWYDSSGIDCRNARCTEWLSQSPLVESLLQTCHQQR